MGELAFGEGEQPHRRSVCGPERRQESSQAARGSLRGETGNCVYVLNRDNCQIYC